MSPNSPKFPPTPPTVASGQGVQHWEVTEEYAGQRIDNYLLARLKGVPKTRIYKMLRTGEVRVNGGRAASDYRVQAGDRLRIPPVRVSANAPAGGDLQAAVSRVSPAMAKSVSEKIAVVQEDESMLAINKPCGLAVHGGSGVKLGVIEAMRATQALPFLELVHRLDRETSGVMLLAKRRSALTEFHRQLREGGMRKRYLALAWGVWPKGLEKIDAPLHKWVNAKGERWVRVQEGGQVAITRTRLLQQTSHPVFGDVAFVQCEPVTGRTHQLRVHLASVGCPIIGDPKYGLHERDAQFGLKAKSVLATRMMLHAWQLKCLNPKSAEPMHLLAEPDALFAQALETLKLRMPR